MVVSGPAGSGKTTLLRIIAGQIEPTDGRVVVDGMNVRGVQWEKRERLLGDTISVVPTTPLVLNRAAAADTLLLALSCFGLSRNQAAGRAKWALEFVGLAHRSDCPASVLSETDRQKLSIARALAPRPKVILADDPILTLDNSATSEVINVLNRASDRGITVIMATRRETLGETVAPAWVRLSAGRIRE